MEDESLEKKSEFLKMACNVIILPKICVDHIIDHLNLSWGHASNIVDHVLPTKLDPQNKINYPPSN